MINALPSVGTDPVVGLKTLCDQHPGKVVFTTSMGLEDQALTDLIARNELPVRVVTLDTGRLFQETYDLMDRTRAMYPGLEFETYFPAAESLEAFVNSQGMSSIFKSVEARKTCCGIRKIDPFAPCARGRRGVGDWLEECPKRQPRRAVAPGTRRHVRQAEVQSAAGLDRRRPRHLRQLPQRSHQSPAPEGLPLHRLRPLHPGGDGWRAPPRRQVVVGAIHQRVRLAQRVIPRMGHL